MNLMELPSIHRKIISVIIVVAIISTSMFILVDLSNQNGSKNISTVGNNPSPPPAQTSPSYLSNITVKLNVSPSFYTNSTTGIAPLPTNSSFPSFKGAVVELFASPSYPNESLNNTNPAYYISKNSTPLSVTFVNLTWNAVFKLPKTIYNITKTWKHTFGYSGSNTSMIISITYFTKSQSTNATAFFFTGAVSYNPFLMVSGYTMNIMKHPYANYLPYSSVAEMNLTGNNTIYPGFTSNSSSSNMASPDYIPPPGGGSCKTYWGWGPVQTISFKNVPIPFVYLNDTAAQPGVNLSYTLNIGSIYIKTGFSLSSEYFNTSSNIVIMGSTPTYSTLVGVIAGTAGSTKSFPISHRDSVAGFYGNMSATKYRYEEFELAGPNAGKVISVTNKYELSMKIDSLDRNGNQLIPFQMFVGNITASKYNSTSFINLTLQKRYAVAFGTLFTGNSLENTYNGKGSYTGCLTVVSKYNNGTDLCWSNIYSGLSIYSPNSDLYSSINSYVSIGLAIAAVALAVIAIPYADAASVPAIIVALLGLSTALGSFNTAVISIHSSTYVYFLSITDTGTNNAQLQYYMVTDGIEIGTDYVNVPNTYFIVK